MQSLKDQCIKLIATRYSMFKERMDILPVELQEDIKQELLESKMQLLGDKWYPRQSVIVTSSDWGNYKL